MIYFAKFVKLGVVKVGYTRNVATRMKQHRRAQGEVTFLFSMNGGIDLEKSIHSELRHKRAGGYCGYEGRPDHFNLSDLEIEEIKDRHKTYGGFTEEEGEALRHISFAMSPDEYTRLRQLANKGHTSFQELLNEAVSLLFYERELDTFIPCAGYSAARGGSMKQGIK